MNNGERQELINYIIDRYKFHKILDDYNLEEFTRNLQSYKTGELIAIKRNKVFLDEYGRMLEDDRRTLDIDDLKEILLLKYGINAENLPSQQQTFQGLRDKLDELDYARHITAMIGGNKKKIIKKLKSYD